jgi:hypothetical protein
MKKQLLIAAVAATMGTAAIADISITGGMKVNYTNTEYSATTASTNTVTNETDLAIAATNGDTSVRIELSVDGNGSTNTEDVHLSTKIGDVSVKTGVWNSTDTIFTDNATRTGGNWILSSAVSGVGIALEGDSNASATKTTLSGDIAGVSVKYAMKSASNELFLSSDVSGFGVTYAMIDADAANSSASAFTVSKEFNGVTASYSSVDADSLYTIKGDTAAFGNAVGFMGQGDDATAIKLSTSMGGNTISARFVSVDGATSATDVDVNTFQVTRALAGGTTLEVTYTDTDESGATIDKESLDIELAVKF